ncbi:MAG: class I SAM-dependent methyltransferase [Thermomicrobia bacterium]|nr:class I SAM-dependent methyltransferase [Thermomicrobia bacterium]MCA1724634.1 class I SAM-dependent methyltransferase [Thermomicrobia bacterium]
MPADTVTTPGTPIDARTQLPADVSEWLRCPRCGAVLRARGDALHCTNEGCGADYPLLNGIPILINEANSVFTIAEFQRHQTTFFAPRGRLERLLERRLPHISRNVAGRRNYEQFAAQLLARTSAPTVLVIGGGILGDGMDVLLSYPSIRLVESDVALEARTALLCDAHDIPFQDGVFDGVIAQAVLEHVADPSRCVAEMHRVLKAQGLIYAETPFMQQVHGGRYDFTRFTYLGHRRLFRQFDEIASGTVCGPGMALAWSLMYFLLSFTTTIRARKAVRLVSRLLFFPLTYCDYYLVRKQAALDAASGFSFLGSKSDTTLSDRELIQRYRGGM